NIWTLAGFELDSPLRVTRYRDAVLIEKVPAELANTHLRSKLAKGKRPYGSKRFGRAVLETVQGDTLTVVAMQDALVIIDGRRSVREFGLTVNDGTTFNTPASLTPVANVEIVENTIVPLEAANDEDIQIHGDWLPNFGFTPGSRFNLVEDPHV